MRSVRGRITRIREMKERDHLRLRVGVRRCAEARAKVERSSTQQRASETDAQRPHNGPNKRSTHEHHAHNPQVDHSASENEPASEARCCDVTETVVLIADFLRI